MSQLEPPIFDCSPYSNGLLLVLDKALRSNDYREGSLEIDRIRSLRRDAAVWLVYAGRGRAFLDEFADNNAIFLSLPGFAATRTVFESAQATRRHLAMADQVALWIFGTRRTVPSRQPSSYSTTPYASGTAEAKAFAAELGNIRRMFKDMKSGDIVLCPRKGPMEPFLIGEIKGEWSDGDDLVIDKLGKESVPFRKVRWLDTALARRDFSPRVARRLQNQHAITRLDDRFYREILDNVYPSYIWDSTSKLEIYGENYRGTDPLQIYPTAELIKYIVASALAFEDGKIDLFKSMDPDLAIDLFYDENLIEHFGQNFNSPGAFSLITRRRSLAAMVAAGLIVATAGTNGNTSAQMQDATGKISGALDGPEKVQQSTHMNNYIHSMSSVDWNALQKAKGEKARETLDLSLSKRRTIARHRDELNAR